MSVDVEEANGQKKPFPKVGAGRISTRSGPITLMRSESFLKNFMSRKALSLSSIKVLT
jgi:hypothetical protein